jgi:hypothetical protein
MKHIPVAIIRSSGAGVATPFGGCGSARTLTYQQSKNIHRPANGPPALMSEMTASRS